MFPLGIFFKGLVLTGLITFAVNTPSLAQEVEPNEPCTQAQDLGAVTFPFSLAGELAPIGDIADIDFFRFTASPGAFLRADHQGATFGNGSLPDPLLGLFDSSCNLLNQNDDSGSVDSRLFFTVPADGTFILAATAFPDFAFQGGGEGGTYLLSVGETASIESISGRLVSDRDGTPVPGSEPFFAGVQLFRCFEGSCFEFVNFHSPDANGEFRFESNFNGDRLQAGTYQIQVNANGFDFFVSELFDVPADVAFDLGDVVLTMQSFIGSISGRVVDALGGQLLTGQSPPFAVAVVERCEVFGCFGIVGNPVDDQGRFNFPGLLHGLSPGVYRVSATADDYQQTLTEQFFIGDGEHVDFGNIAITPFPIQFGEVRGCELAPGGGLCEFSIQITNRSGQRFRGEGWSTVDYFPNEAPFRSSRFQVGRIGAEFPLPERINLRRGQSQQLTFQLFVPGDLPDFSTICATATVGQNPRAHFNNQGDRFVFCAVTQAGELRIMPAVQGRQRLLDLNRERATSGPRARRAADIERRVDKPRK